MPLEVSLILLHSLQMWVDTGLIKPILPEPPSISNILAGPFSRLIEGIRL